MHAAIGARISRSRPYLSLIFREVAIVDGKLIGVLHNDVETVCEYYPGNESGRRIEASAHLPEVDAQSFWSRLRGARFQIYEGVEAFSVRVAPREVPVIVLSEQHTDPHMCSFQRVSAFLQLLRRLVRIGRLPTPLPVFKS